MSEPMGPFQAVFNGHINRAHLRAGRRMRERHPREWAKVKKIVRRGGGIMAIFRVNPNPATRMYVELVTALVNEKAPPARRPAAQS